MILLIDWETVTRAEEKKGGQTIKQVPHQTSPLRHAVRRRRRFENLVDYQDEHEVGGEGGLVLK